MRKRWIEKWVWSILICAVVSFLVMNTKDIIDAFILGFEWEIMENDVESNIGYNEEMEAFLEEDKEAMQGGIRIIVDPGHGDEDPGKVGVNGALEKDINLAIGLVVCELLQEEGYEVLMTRVDDSGILEGESYSATAELQARVSMINAENPDLVVSIHQNSYTDESVKGPQVFYCTGSGGGMLAAQLIQEELWKLDPDSRREIKDDNSYYLLVHTQVPTVIVECGFLSNTSDASKLVDATYQEEMGATIVEGICAYFG